MYGPKGNKGDKVLNLNSVVVALRVLTYLESVFGLNNDNLCYYQGEGGRRGFRGRRGVQVSVLLFCTKLYRWSRQRGNCKIPYYMEFWKHLNLAIFRKIAH